MNNIIPFKYKKQEIRIIQDEQGEPWWVAKDVCKVLGLNNITEATKRLDEDEKGFNLIETLGGLQQMLIINEPGLYSLILRSDKPEAQPYIHSIHDIKDQSLISLVSAIEKLDRLWAINEKEIASFINL